MREGYNTAVAPKAAPPLPPGSSVLNDSDGLVNRLLAIESRLVDVTNRMYGPWPQADEGKCDVEGNNVAAILRVAHRTVGRIEELVSQLQDGL